jgi:hypothetical protein
MLPAIAQTALAVLVIPGTRSTPRSSARSREDLSGKVATGLVDEFSVPP